MHRLKLKNQSKARRQAKIRKTVIGTTHRPRLTVFISHHHVTAQVIDDSTGKTLVYASSVGQKNVTGTKTEIAQIVGTAIGQKAKSSKIKKVTFDRNGRLYHGRLKALADAARNEGLEF
ncbi:MAG: 50S ribosomal protein L18 [Patescibacteria group bacterium]